MLLNFVRVEYFGKRKVTRVLGDRFLDVRFRTVVILLGGVRTRSVVWDVRAKGSPRFVLRALVVYLF